jgi:hypothetical protein
LLAELILLADEVGILIFDDPAEQAQSIQLAWPVLPGCGTSTKVRFLLTIC